MNRVAGGQWAALPRVLILPLMLLVNHGSIGNSSTSTSRSACKQSNASPQTTFCTYAHPHIRLHCILLYSLAVKSNLFLCSTWTKFNKVMARHVEAAFQNRALAPTPTLRLPHPRTGTPVDYTYDFSATPMMQVRLSSEHSHTTRAQASRT